MQAVWLQDALEIALRRTQEVGPCWESGLESRPNESRTSNIRLVRKDDEDRFIEGLGQVAEVWRTVGSL